jgi:hypothetical protein
MCKRPGDVAPPGIIFAGSRVERWQTRRPYQGAEQERIIAEYRGRIVELMRAELSWEKMEAAYYRM